MPGTRLTFATSTGAAVPSASTAEMREVMRIASDHTGPGLLPMLENAGRAAALAAFDVVAGGAESLRSALVLVGTNWHAAAAVCAARHLANRGVAVQVVSIMPPHESDGALGQQFLALAETPARVLRWDAAFVATDTDLVVEGIIGDRLEGAPFGAEMGLVRAAGHAAEGGVPVLSLDVPSGLDPATGETPGFAVQATRTLALGLPRPGLRPEVAGELWLADLGIPPGVYARAGIVVTPVFAGSDRVPLTYPELARNPH